MKQAVIFASFLTLLGCMASPDLEYETFNQYFFKQEQKVLEEELHQLEKEAFIHEPYSLGSNLDNHQWIQKMYNLSSIATSLLKGLRPVLTVEEVGEIATSLDWVRAWPTATIYDNNQWHFVFQWKYPVRDDVHREPEVVTDWRKLTNRVLLWKTRQDNWRSLIPPSAAPTSTSSAMAKQRLLNDLLAMLLEKYDSLFVASCNLGLRNKWIDTIFTASMISEPILHGHVLEFTVESARQEVKALGWILVPRGAGESENIWDYQVNVNVERADLYLTWISSFDQILQKVQMSTILTQWVAITNEVLDWKLWSINESGNGEK